MTLANIYFNVDTDTKEQMLESALYSRIAGENEFGTFVICIYTFSDESQIGFLGDYEADLLENILAEMP